LLLPAREAVGPEGIYIGCVVTKEGCVVTKVGCVCTGSHYLFLPTVPVIRLLIM
jgi:hypothetical protein